MSELVGRVWSPAELGLRLDWHPLIPLGTDARIACLDHMLLGLARRPVRSEVLAAVELIAAHEGVVRLTELERHVGLGASQLQRLFASHVGVSPKQYARIRRFLCARRLAREVARGHATLAGIAVRAGFADQAHLTREVQAFAALTPARLARLGDAVFVQD